MFQLIASVLSVASGIVLVWATVILPSRRRAFFAALLVGLACCAVSSCGGMKHTPDGDHTMTIVIHGCGWAK